MLSGISFCHVAGISRAFHSRVDLDRAVHTSILPASPPLSRETSLSLCHGGGEAAMAGRSWARWHWPPTMAGQIRPLARRAVALAPRHGRARCPRPPARRRGGPGAAAPRQGRGSMGPRRTAAPPARAAAPPAPRRSGGVDSNAVAATTSSELEVAAGGCGRRFPSRHCCSSWLRYRRAISFLMFIDL